MTAIQFHIHISKMLDAVEILLPAIPVMLYSGLGKPQIEKLLSLRKSASSCWTRLYAGEGIDFEMLFQDTWQSSTVVLTNSFSSVSRTNSSTR